MAERPFKVGMRSLVWASKERNPFLIQMDQARAAEEIGFDGVFFGDRMLAEARTADQTIYASTHTEIFHTLSSIAAVTHRIAIGSLVLVVPFRHPVQLAKMVASLDLLSQGRLILGVGAGWNKKEFQSLGLDRASRGQRLDESLQIMQKLWQGRRVTFHGTQFVLDDVGVDPLPFQSGGPPLWFGSFAPESVLEWKETGEMPASLRRALNRVGKYGDGWVPLPYSARTHSTVGPELLGAGWKYIRQRAQEVGRDPSALTFALEHWVYIMEGPSSRQDCEEYLQGFYSGTFEQARNQYLIGTVDEIVARIRHLTSGIDRVAWYIFTLIGPTQRQLELLWNELIPRLEG